MPLRNVATTFTIEQQRLEINNLAGDVNNIATGVTATTASGLAAGATGADLTLSGTLTVNGSQTILNTATLEVEDKNIVIAKGATTDAAASGGGITLKGANDKTISYSQTGDKWVSNIDVEIVGDLEVQGAVTSTAFLGNGSQLTNLTSANLTGALPAIDGSALTGIAAGGATVADAGNANANRTILFSANASGSNQTLNTDGGILYNAAEDALKVNGTIITAGGITGAGGSCVVAAANHSSTCSITVSDDVQVAGKFLQGATSTNSNTIFHVEGTIANGAEFIGNNSQQGFYLALQNKSTNNDAWTTIQSWDAGGQGVSSIRFIQVNNANNQGAIAFRTRDTSGGEQERLRIGSAGQFGLAGANYGSSGQVLTSQGGSAPPQWASAGGGGGTEAYFFMGGAGQSLSSSTWTRVACSTAYQDSVSGCDVSTNVGRYIVQSGHAGRYYFIGQCSTFANSNDITRADVKIYKNGSIFAGAYQHVISGGSGHARHVGPQIATMDNASVGDYYELWVVVNGTGVSLSMDGETSKSNYFMGWKIAD